MMSTGLSMTKPAIATAVPVKLLSSEMTTGMSAPPMGRVMVMPKIRAAARMTSIRATLGDPVANRNRATTTVISARPAVTNCPPGMMIGFPGMSPWSLPAATIDPVKVIEPMMMSRTMKTFVSRRTAEPVPARCR
jgi:hypothetical protein